MRVLFVCTANQCRSPMAEVLCELIGGSGVGDLVVASAGLLPGGFPASSGAIEVMAERNLDLRGHRSQTVDTEMLRRADLVIAMARQHVRELALMDRASYLRTFTLKEAVRRGRAVGPRHQGEPLATWARRLSEGRTTRDLLGDHLADDVADPIGQTVGVYRATADELEELVGRLLRLIDPE